jgi:hypothetical protein
LLAARRYCGLPEAVLLATEMTVASRLYIRSRSCSYQRALTFFRVCIHEKRMTGISEEFAVASGVARAEKAQEP